MLAKFRCYVLSVEFYHLAQKLKLRRPLRDQMDRASASISLNLAEGYGKTSFQEKQKFYVGALASTRECQAILELAQTRQTDILGVVDRLGASIFCLTRWRP
jgi:four helix bundle protein